MSEISKIYSSYGDSLRYSQDKYTNLYNERANAAAEFYEAFFHNLTIPFSDVFENPSQ